jgi:hypothetical protein
MTQYKPNTGLLGVNDRKEKDTHPDVTGKIFVSKPGFYYLKGWKKTSRDGRKLMSLAADYADDDKQKEESSKYEALSLPAPNKPTVAVSDEAPF